MALEANQINTNDCAQIINNALGQKNVDIDSWKIQPFTDEINGYLGEHLLLEILWRSEGKVQNSHTFFMKAVKYSNELMERSRDEDNNIFRKESFFYNTFLMKSRSSLGVDVSNFAPKCYLQKGETLVMENLAIKGFVLADCEVLPDDHIYLALGTLAKLHVDSLAYEFHQSKSRGSPYRIVDDYGHILAENMLTKDKEGWGPSFIKSCILGISALIDILPQNVLAKGEFKNKYWLAIEQFYRVFKEENNFRKVICHGDIWRKNILFKYEEGRLLDCKLCDFQLLRYAPPAHDVAYLLYHNTNSDISKIKFKPFLEQYYSHLEEELLLHGIKVEDLLTMDELEESYAFYLPSVKLLSVFFSSLSMRCEEYQSQLYQNQDEFNEFVFVDRSQILVEQFQQNEGYRKFMTRLLLNIEEMLI